MTTKWDLLPVPIVIEIISWLNQDSVTDLSLVSKQLNNIIANEPGNKNTIIPVFEIRGNSAWKFANKLRHHFLSNSTANKLQGYQLMRFNDVHKFGCNDAPIPHPTQLLHILKNVQMKGITTLDISSPFPTCCTNWILSYILPNILPQLRGVDFSNTDISDGILQRFSQFCPHLEKITLQNNNNTFGISLSGYSMCSSKNLKEINMDDTVFYMYDGIADLDNHQEIFLLYQCCKALQCVSIKNMKYSTLLDDDDDGDDDNEYDELQKMIYTQNLLIKFVRNAPPVLRWLRSDLTQENIKMLRLERPGIELVN